MPIAIDTMQAAVLYGKEDVRLESVPVPAIGPGEMLVRVRTALTCGTDVKVFRRGYHAKMIRPPALFGHEMAGDVVAVGEGVFHFRAGQRIVAANSAPCDHCFFCRHGQQNLCQDLLFNNGAYAEYIRLPARIVQKNTYLIPESLEYKDAALVEPLACAVRGLDESNVHHRGDGSRSHRFNVYSFGEIRLWRSCHRARAPHRTSGASQAFGRR